MRDVAVIGAGVVGCLAARELSRFDLDIVVLEAGLDLASGATRANSGIVHAGYDPKPGTLKAAYNVRGARLYPQLQRELGFAYFKNGALVLAFSQEDCETLQLLQQQAAENGAAETFIVHREALRQMEPNVSSEAVAALHVPDSGVCDPYGLTYGAAENAANNGVEFCFDAKVTSIKSREGGFSISLANGQVVEARAIVNAAGIHSDEMNNYISQRKLTIQPKRGEYYLYENTLHPFRHTMFQCPSEKGKGVLVTTVAFGNVICGPNSEEQECRGEVATTAEGLTDVLQKAQRTWTQASEEKVISNFAGLRATNADGGDFVIGQAPDAPGFFNAACIDSPGLASAPAIAQDLAKWVAEYLDAKENAEFDPVRVPAPLLVMMPPEAVAALVEENPAYGKPVCRCCHVSEGELVEAMHRPIPVFSLDALKWRTGATMGPCQGCRCTAKIMDLMVRELGVSPADIQKRNQGSPLVFEQPGWEGIPRIVSDPLAYEKPRSSYCIPGDRPAGVYSAACALDLLAMPDCLPGTNAVVWGETDMACDCANKLQQAGIKVQRVQGQIRRINGKGRVESVLVEADGDVRQIDCDLLVISGHMMEASE